jgi:hypothetical protein
MRKLWLVPVSVMVLLVGVTLALGPRGAAAQDVRNFWFQNASPSTWVVELNVSPATQASWGPNVLSRAVQPGESIPVVFTHPVGSFPGVSTCVYDLRIVGNDGRDETNFNLNLCDTATISWTPGRQTAPAAQIAPQTVPLAPVAAAPQPAPAHQLAPAGAQRTFTLQNFSAVWVVELNVSPATSQTWGPNVLGQPIQPGESRPVTFTPQAIHTLASTPGAAAPNACLFDLRVLASDGFAAEEFNVNLCQTPIHTFR